MPCKHKFFNDLNLSYIKDYDPETLIIGTFNPGWKNINNDAAWFYGRKENNFWDVLPLVYGEEHGLRNLQLDDECKKKVWQDFCKKHKIAITDFVECIRDADENNTKDQESLGKFKDEKLMKFKLDFTDISSILNDNPKIKNAYFTRKSFNKINKIKKEWDSLEKEYKSLKFELLLTPSNNAANSFKKELELIKNAVLPRFISTEWNKNWHNIKNNSK